MYQRVLKELTEELSKPEILIFIYLFILTILGMLEKF